MLGRFTCKMFRSINFITFFLFALAYVFNYWLGLEWLKLIPGILLLFYLPGYNLNSILLFKRERLPWFFRLGLDISSSLALLSFLYLVLQNIIGYFEFNIVIFVLVVNAIMAIAKYIIVKDKSTISGLDKKEGALLIIYSIPVLLFIFKLILNPYIFEIDSLHYFDAYNNLLTTGTSVGSLFAGREAFPFYMLAAHYIAGFSYITFFKFFSPLLFYLTSGMILIFTNERKKPVLNWFYLLIIASPMLAVMNEGVRPETFSIALTPPALILSYLSIKKNDITSLILSILFALIAFRFHESASILLPVSIATAVIMLIQNYLKIYSFVKNNLLITIAAIIPYFLTIRAYRQSLLDFFDSGLTRKFYIIISNGLEHIRWDWWFIDNATTNLGAKISWPGYTAIWYYLYGGITVLIFFISVIVLSLSLKKKTDLKVAIAPLIPLIFFFFIHISFAELLPRMGIILLFNRSWPYIALSSAIMSIILVSMLFNAKISRRIRLILIAGLVACSLTGAVGAVVSSFQMGGMVLPQEKQAIKEMSILPENALIVSTQRNQNLVKIYANKSFLQISQEEFSIDNFKQDTVQRTFKAAQESIDQSLREVKITEATKHTRTFEGKKIFEESTSDEINDPELKLSILNKHDPIAYSLVNKKIKRLESINNRGIYLIYSFAKIDNGILSTRDWWIKSSDETNYNFFRKYTGDTIVKNDNFIIIQIN